MATRDDIVKRVYQLLGDPSDVEEFDENDVVLPKIESIISRICKGEYINPITNRTSRSGYLPFLDDTKFYTSVSPTTLTADVTLGDLTINLDTNGLLNSVSEYILINGDIINYTGVTLTSITGVTGIDTNHKAGDLVYQLYQLPTNITKPHSLWQVIDTQRKSKVDFRDSRIEHYGNHYYTILRDGLIDLLNIVGFGEQKFMLNYINKSDIMLNGTDECIIPDCTEVVAHLAAGELLYEYEEEDGAVKMNHGQAMLDEMFGFFAKQTSDKDRRIVSGSPVRFSQAYGTYGRGTGYNNR